MHPMSAQVNRRNILKASASGAGNICVRTEAIAGHPFFSRIREDDMSTKLLVDRAYKIHTTNG